MCRGGDEALKMESGERERAGFVSGKREKERGGREKGEVGR